MQECNFLHRQIGKIFVDEEKILRLVVAKLLKLFFNWFVENPVRAQGARNYGILSGIIIKI